MTSTSTHLGSSGLTPLLAFSLAILTAHLSTSLDVPSWNLISSTSLLGKDGEHWTGLAIPLSPLPYLGATSDGLSDQMSLPGLELTNVGRGSLLQGPTLLTGDNPTVYDPLVTIRVSQAEGAESDL